MPCPGGIISSLIRILVGPKNMLLLPSHFVVFGNLQGLICARLNDISYIEIYKEKKRRLEPTLFSLTCNTRTLYTLDNIFLCENINQKQGQQNKDTTGVGNRSVIHVRRSRCNI